MLPDLITAVPGPESLRLAGELRRYESRNVTYLAEDWPVFWERAEGANVWDVDGNRFVDLTGAFAVAGLGHGRAEVVEAMTKQAGKLLHGMGDVHPTRLKAELCRTLSEMTFERWGAGVGKTVLSNSGFEAVETALKTALLATGRPKILAFENGYHGLGYGALLGTGFEKFRKPFESQLSDLTTWLPYPAAGDGLDELRGGLAAVENGSIGAVLVEPIQGRGGVVLPPEGFLKALRTWCDEEGALLIVDEIYTGFHRTGSLFACEHDGVVPDLICLGKALSGGFPISACVGKAEVMDAWPESTGEALHTSTFLGHPVGCAMALEALRLHRDVETAQMVEDSGQRLEKLLRELEMPFISEVRGRGIMWGVELDSGERAMGIVMDLLRAGYLALPGGPEGKVLCFSPPFGIGEEELRGAVGVIGKA